MISLLPDSITALKSSKDLTSVHLLPVGIILNKHKPEAVPPTLPPTGSMLPVVSVVLGVGIIVGGLNVVPINPDGFDATISIGAVVGFFVGGGVTGFSVGGTVITSTGFLVIATIGGLVGFAVIIFVVGLIEGAPVGVCVGAFVGIGFGFNVGFEVGILVLRIVGKGVGSDFSNTMHDFDTES